MTFEELKDKALSLPYEPGVYIMQDKTGTVIYVGKAKKLKNRVSQYFQDTAAHTPKTRKMVSQIDHFDTIVARSEFEALVLECSLIKRHMPKYNILLKDDKGYPYLRVDLTQDYPVMQMVSKTAGDKASYFGPFGGRSVTQHVIDTLRLTLKLPGCSKQFPRDLGKDRPCLNFHMNNCDGWCQPSRSQQDYHARMEQAVLILQGNYKKVADELRTQMEAAADKLQFELAASLRDRLRAVESLGEKQLVTAGTMANTDVIGYYQNEARACFAVLHYVSGSLLDKEYEILSPADDPQEAVSALVKQFYLARGTAPKVILTIPAISSHPKKPLKKSRITPSIFPFLTGSTVCGTAGRFSLSCSFSSSTNEPFPGILTIIFRSASISRAFLLVILLTLYCSINSFSEGSFEPGGYIPFSIASSKSS